MRKATHFLMNFPEYYIIVLILLAGYSPPFTFNPLLILLAGILLLQIIFKNRISGLIIAGIFILINLFMLGAFFSEFGEFQELNNDAKQLLLGGLSLWGINMMLSAMMIYKYTKTDSINKFQIVNEN